MNVSCFKKSGSGVGVGLLVKGAVCGTPSVLSVEDKVWLVLAVISGEMTTAEAARRGKASEQSISTWKRQFLEGGKAGLDASGSSQPSQPERALADENEELKAALGEAHVERRVLNKSAEHRLGLTMSSRRSASRPGCRRHASVGWSGCRSAPIDAGSSGSGGPAGQGPWPTPSADKVESAAIAFFASISRNVMAADRSLAQESRCLLFKISRSSRQRAFPRPEAARNRMAPGVRSCTAAELRGGSRLSLSLALASAIRRTF
jgi:transposase